MKYLAVSCFNNSVVLPLVGLPARPKSPVDPKKDGESLSYSVLPLSDGPEGSHSRPQVSRLACWSMMVRVLGKKWSNILLFCVLKALHVIVHFCIEMQLILCYIVGLL